MDLKDFQDIKDEGLDEKKDNIQKSAPTPKAGANMVQKNKKDNHLKTKPLVDSEFHDETNKLIKELESRIADLNKKENQDKPEDKLANSSSSTDSPEAKTESSSQSKKEEIDLDTETIVVKEGEGQTFLEKIQPFILPVFLTLFALIFSAIFLYFFSESRIERSAQAIVNNQTQPEIIIIKEEKPEITEIIEVPKEDTVECDPKTQVLNEEKNVCEDLPPPPKPKFNNGTTTLVRVRFAYDKYNYDTFPMGIYLVKNQTFEGEYENYKLLPTNRAFANDFFFGINRYTVSLIGACKYVVDEAEILVENMRDSTGGEAFRDIGNKYFTGKVVKILNASKPHVVCDKFPRNFLNTFIPQYEYKDNLSGNRVPSTEYFEEEF